MMKPHQQTAFSDPCFHATETSKRKFTRRHSPPHDWITTVFTANVGLE